MSEYDRGYFDSLKRAWALVGSLELKYTDGSAEGTVKIAVLAELATLLMAEKPAETP